MKSQALFDNSYQYIDGDRNPDLGLDRVLRGAIECLDPQVLLDPFEEQLDLPAALVQLGDNNCGKREVVGQEDELFLCYCIEITDTPQFFGIVFQSVKPGGCNDLVCLHPGGPVHRLGVETLEDEVAFCTCHKEGLILVNPEEAGKIYIASIHDVDSASLDKESVEDIDIVNFAMSNIDNHRDAASQIQEGMELHCCLALAELGPREYRKTEIDNRRVEGINGGIEFRSEIVAGIESSCCFDQYLCKVGVDSPVAVLVGVSQGVSGDLSTDAHVIEFGFRHTQTCLDVSETFPVGQLCKGHAEELIPAREGLHLVIAVISLYALLKLVGGDKIHQLSKNCFANIHKPSPFAVPQKYGLQRKYFSNRKISYWDKNSNLSIC